MVDVKLALKNKHIYFRDNSSLFLTMHFYFQLLIMLQRGCLMSPELSCNHPGWGRESWLLCFASWCLVSVVLLFLMMPLICLQFVIVVFPDHTHYF